MKLNSAQVQRTLGSVVSTKSSLLPTEFVVVNDSLVDGHPKPI
jgi:hypothetical protein